ncbi:hypothetical protein ACQ2H7_004516 [Candidozyma auris]
MPSTIGASDLVERKVTVSPLVLLSVADHFDRVAKDSSKRVVGVLLGHQSQDTIKVTNSYAIPFEEDEKNSSVWFLDHNYIESMGEMFKKINAKEKLVGWYHSGPKLRASDLKINDVFKRYTPNPLLVIVDVQPRSVGIPTDAYYAVDDIKHDGSKAERTFVHIPSLIEAEEAEEIGVEHLLRDIRDQAAGNLTLRATETYRSLLGLHEKLREISNYLEKVYIGVMPINQSILGKLQNVFNLLPHILGDESTKSAGETQNSAEPLMDAFMIKSNDQMMMVYVSTLVRSIIAFHDLIENKPIVKGVLTSNQAFKFAAITGIAGSFILYHGVNPTVAALGMSNIILYGWCYTSLKRKSILNTWVGAIVGAIPPLMGWAASSSLSHPGAWCLAALLYAWQFPHFNALSHNIATQYKEAGYVMAAAENPRLNSRVSLRYSLLMFPICFGLSYFGVTDWVFCIDSSIANAWLSVLAYRFWKQQKINHSTTSQIPGQAIEAANLAARKLFWCSVWQLPAVLILAMLHKKGQWDRLLSWIGIL